ncbi:uncharacterized protein LOC105161982 [Sesamum indicum]|uniref:Uncharacterized protein LOC105161982 n=1 Tax=Sesamum indicum TaxID=4182 RepID=A0A6I9T3G7_SESIN|nr:uncharacterized protein LOC105161982 [Sesamum indicum]
MAVTVSGTLDSATLEKRLVRAGKCLDDDEDEEEMKHIRDKIIQLAFLKQQAEANAKKVNRAMAAKMNLSKNQLKNKKQRDKSHFLYSSNAAANGNHNAGTKGSPSQNMVTKANLGGGLDQNTLDALKKNNKQLAAGGNMDHLGEAKRANDIGIMMNPTGFHGNGDKT